MSRKKANFSFEIIIEKDQVFVEEYIHGKRRNIPVFVGSANNYDIAQACRKLAHTLLEKADGIQHSKDFYHEINAQNQIELMMEENNLTFN